MKKENYFQVDMLGDNPSLQLSGFIMWEFSDPLRNIEYS